MAQVGVRCAVALLGALLTPAPLQHLTTDVPLLVRLLALVSHRFCVSSASNFFPALSTPSCFSLPGRGFRCYGSPVSREGEREVERGPTVTVTVKEKGGDIAC